MQHLLSLSWYLMHVMSSRMSVILHANLAHVLTRHASTGEHPSGWQLVYLGPLINNASQHVVFCCQGPKAQQKWIRDQQACQHTNQLIVYFGSTWLVVSKI